MIHFKFLKGEKRSQHCRRFYNGVFCHLLLLKWGRDTSRSQIAEFCVDFLSRPSWGRRAASLLGKPLPLNLCFPRQLAAGKRKRLTRRWVHLYISSDCGSLTCLYRHVFVTNVNEIFLTNANHVAWSISSRLFHNFDAPLDRVRLCVRLLSCK